MGHILDRFTINDNRNMDSHSIHVMTIANSIIGVSIIAMPYCFKQCGIILSIIMLIFSSIISRLSCHFLLKSAIRARLRTFEFLAYHAFGPLGKFVVEIGMIGFLLGTCIAFFVVMGDLGPAIVAEMIEIKNTNTLRSGILISLATFCVLPLGLLRNVDSLNGVCIATIGFYGCLVLKIMAESSSHILTGDWYNKVEFWRIEGALQCIPIFSMALFCQTQLFEIYQAIPNASLEKMNALIRTAVNICTGVYIFVGVFGYAAFSEKTFTGNVLLSLTPSLLTQIIKIGFVLSLAFSFPLIIFPCRASLFSLIYKPTYTMLHDGGAHFIPESKFRTITIFIILISLIIGILIPNIELVLGLVGSTIGVSICVLFPATCFICMVKKNTNERILAQIMLCTGIVVMVLGTYANVNAVDDISLSSVTQQSELKQPVNDLLKTKDKILAVIHTTDTLPIPNVKPEESIVQDDVIKEIRHEPPQPVEPAESREIKSKDNEKLQQAPVQAKPQTKESELQEIRRDPLQPIESEPKINEIKKIAVIPLEGNSDDKVRNNDVPKENVQLDKQPNVKTNDINSVADQVDVEAIKKEDKEINQQAQEDLKNVVQKLDLISKMQKQNQEQQQHIVEQQKKILQEMQQRKDPFQEQAEIDKVHEQKLKAVQEIQAIAKKAIESLVDDPKQVENKVSSKEEGKQKPVNINDSSVIQASIKSNSAPLSYQLRLNNVLNDTITSKISEKNPVIDAFVPFPLVKSGFLTSVNVSNLTSGLDKIVEKSSIFNENVNTDKNKAVADTKVLSQKNTNQTLMPNNENKNLTGNKNDVFKTQEDTNIDEIKSMRRDILSENDTLRNKRHISNLTAESEDEYCEKNKTNSNQIESSKQKSKGSVLLNSLKLEV